MGGKSKKFTLIVQPIKISTSREKIHNFGISPIVLLYTAIGQRCMILIKKQFELGHGRAWEAALEEFL